MAPEPSRSIRILQAEEADPVKLSAFLQEAFGSAIEGFLAEHADWWHRGTGNRYVALCDGEVAGYRGWTPSVCLFEGKELPCVWAFDLFVLPRYRGLGMQKLLDQRLREAAPLVMSFPGDLGATIYSKQGYDVREDVHFLEIVLAPKPLVPPEPGASALVRHVLGRSRELGVRGTARQTLERVRALGARTQSAKYQPRRTDTIASPDPDMLQEMFLRHVDRHVATTLRSADYLSWRYLAAPYRSQLAFYLCHSNGRPTLFGVVRYLEPTREARILDVFGDVGDEECLTDLIRTVLRDSADRGMDALNVLASSPGMLQTLEAVGFRRLYPRKFRWQSNDEAVNHRFSTIELQWVLADSCLDRRG